MADDFSLMQEQEGGEGAMGFSSDTKQGERNRLQPFMEAIAQPDVSKQMQAGAEAAEAGVQQFNIEAQSQYDMALRGARERLAAAQTASDGDTAQSIADRKLLADQLAMPFSVVTKAQEEAKKELVIRNLSQDQYMAQWASANEINATYARDYLDTVVDFFKGAPEWGNDLMHWLTFDSGKAVERFGYNLTEGAAQANKAFVDFGRMFADNVGLTSASQYLGELSKSLERYRNLAEQNGVGRPKEEKAGALWDEFVKSVPQQVWNLASLALFRRPLPGTLKLGAGGVVGAEAAMAANPLLAEKAGSGLAGMGIMGAQIAGGSYGELREQGVSPEVAGIAAVGNAMMQAPMEKFGMERFVDIFRAKGMKEALLKAVTSIFSEGATEWAQKWPEYLAHTWALSEKHGNNIFDRANWFVSNLFDWKNIQQANDEAMLEAAVGAMWGGLGGGVRIAMTRSMQQRAREQADFLLGVRQVTQMAIDKGMPPEVVKTMLEAKQPLMASTGYVDAEAALTLYQDGNAAVLEALGVTEEELTQLADEGGAVPIQLSDLETRVDQATFDQLYQHVSIRPGSLTAAEGAQPMDADAYTRSAMAQARRRANQIPGVSAELSRMYHELLDAGIPRQQARDNTTLLAVQAATLQAKGFDALSWLKRRKYVVGEDGKAYTVPVGIPQTENAELVSEDLRSQIASSTDSEWLSKLYFGNQQMLDTYAKGTELRSADAQERDRLQAVNAMVTARLAMLNELEQRGWHGSPHDTFERFDDEAIGTGEGHQIHGHGHYIAEDRDTSNDRYRLRLLARAGVRPRLMVDGVEHAGIASLSKDNTWGEDVQRAIEALEAGSAEQGQRLSAQMAEQASGMDLWAGAIEKAVAKLEGMGTSTIYRRHLTEAIAENLPEDKRADTFIYGAIEDVADRMWGLTSKSPDVDDINARRASDVAKALREDAEFLRNDANEMVAKNESIKDIDWSRATVERDRQGQLYEVEIPEEYEMLNEDDVFDDQPEDVQDAMQRLADRHGIEIDEETTGKDFYWALKRKLGTAKAASDALHAEGVKGISYEGGTDGHAWVVFKGEDISIVNTFFQGPGPKPDAEVVGAPTLYQSKKGAKNAKPSMSPQEALGEEAEKKHRIDAEAWKNTVRKYVENVEKNRLNNTENNNEDRTSQKAIVNVLSQTPLVFSLVGAKQLPVTTKLSVLKKAIYGKHKIDADVIEQVAEKLSDPMMIIKSTGDGAISDVTVVLDLKDKHGSTIVVPVAFTNKKNTYEMNLVPSIYAKNDEQTKEPNYVWFENQLRDGNVLYANKDKVRGWNRVARRQLPGWNSIPNAKTIIFEDALVKARLKNPTLYQGSSVRGSYTRMASGEDLIRIFQGHDASTVQHESAHAYHQLLEDMAADDGTAARQACMDALVKTGMLEGVAEQYAGLPVEELGQVIADLQAQAVQLDESMNAEGADKEGIKQEKQSILAQIDALTQLQRHHVAVEQARQDLRTIREWAGVPVEGALTREQYIQVQEQFARGFEGYLATGKAPTTALAGVFARFKQWLLAVYKNIRDYVGADITPEIKDVYDRMLATEEEMQADEVAQAMLGEMPDAIAMLGCNASDYAFLEDLLTRAHMAATSRVDKERNRDRKRRFKAAKEQALTDLLDTPLWRLATGGYGIINYESLKEFLGDKDANELRKKLPKVIKSGDGSTIDVIAMGFEGDGQMAAQFSGNADDLAQMLYEHIVLNGETLNGEATALANQALESQDAEYSVEDGFLAGDEYGDFLDALEDEAAKLQRRASTKGKKKAEARAEAAEQKAEEAQAEAEAKAKAKAEREAKLAGVRAERKTLWAEYQRRAKVELDATPVGQIDPKRYAAMLRKALKGKDNAILSRDPDKAVEAIRKARYAYALMREAKRRRDMVERNLTMVEKLCRRKPGDITPIPATALHRLLQAYGFRVPKRWGGDPAHENDTMQALAAACIAEAQGEDTVEVTPDLAAWVMQEAVPDYAQDASWQSLTWADYNDLMDVFNFFVHASKEQNQNSKDSMKARVEFLVEQAVQSMQGMQTQTSAAKGTWRRAWQNTWRRIFGAIQALQWQFRKADGFKNAGPKGEAGALESLVMRPILEGENEFRARMKELSALLAEPLEKLRQTGLRLQTELGNKHGELIKLGVKLPDDLARSEGRSSWTTDQVIALALNCGNSGNRQRITGGYPDLNYNTLAAIVGSDLAAQICQDNDIVVPEGAVYQSGIFTADDWAAVQAVWDAIETLWEPTVKVHRSMYGFAPRRVDVEPMTFRAQGAPVALRGGYYPIYYDKDISLEAQSWGERDDIMSTTESFFPAPSAKRGHTKSRQKKTKHPLRLSTSTLMDHVQDALKLICFGEAVRFADRVTKHPVFAAEYTRIFGQEDYKAIRPNLKGVVRSEPAPKDAMIKLANATRKYLVSAGLWGNLKVAILQTTALGPAMGDLGAVPVWQAMGRVATGGWGLIREIQQASPYMMSRWRAFDQDLLDKAQSLDINKRPRTVKIGTKEYSWDDVVNMGMTPLCLVDLVTSGAIWQAAYSKYMKGKGLPGSLDQGSQYHAEAVQFADEEVKKSNPDFDASSRSAFLRAQNSYRLFNAFGSAVTLMAQRGEYMLQAMKHKRITKAQFARWEAYEMLAPAVAMTLIMALARGIVGGGDDDDKKLRDLFLESLLDQYSMKVPFFGSIIESTIESAAGISNSGRQPTMRTVVDTPINLFYRVPTAAVKAWDGDDEAKKKLAYAVGDLASFFARVPASKLIRNAERGYDQWQRGEGTPASMLMPAPGK